MHKPMLVICVAVFLASTAVPTRVMAKQLASSTVNSAAAQKREEAKERQEQHPEIRRAMAALRNAKNDLEHAAHDFGGHRAKALEHVNQALSELQEALRYDKK